MIVRTLVAILLLNAVAFAQAPRTAKQEKIERLLALMDNRFRVEQMYEQMKGVMNSIPDPKVSPEVRAKSEAEQKKMFEVMGKIFAPERTHAIEAKVYDEVYTEKEIDGMLAFYQSEVGKSMLKKGPIVQQKVMAGSQEMMLEFMAEMDRIHKVSSKDCKQRQPCTQ
jgi:uncharacterized protein